MSYELRQAVILAGGKGTRLRPYTTVLPKPLVPVGDVPILEVIIRQLRQTGCREVILAVGYLSGLIEAYFGDGKRMDVTLRYVREEKPLSTAGVLSMIDGLDENFLVMNGDILTTLNYNDIFINHVQCRATATIGIVSRDVVMDYGVVHPTDDFKLGGFDEKPTFRYFVSMGVNVLNRRALRHITSGQPLPMPDLLLRIKEYGELVRCFQYNGDWFDIGRIEDHRMAQDYLEKNARLFGF